MYSIIIIIDNKISFGHLESTETFIFERLKPILRSRGSIKLSYAKTKLYIMLFKSLYSNYLF